jgi:hypothetical protein
MSLSPDVSCGSIASVELSWHVGFTPDSGRIAAWQRALGAGDALSRSKRRSGPISDIERLVRNEISLRQRAVSLLRRDAEQLTH